MKDAGRNQFRGFWNLFRSFSYSGLVSNLFQTPVRGRAENKRKNIREARAGKGTPTGSIKRHSGSSQSAVGKGAGEGLEVGAICNEIKYTARTLVDAIHGSRVNS